MRFTCTRGRAAWACAWLLLAAAPAFSQPAGGQATEKRATLVVRLPADAVLMVDGQITKQTGEFRRFFSPPLPVGQGFRYELEATWTGPDNKPVRVSRVARVRAGETTPIDLRTVEGKEPKPPVDKPPVDKPPVDKPPVDKPPVDRPLVGKEPKLDVVFVPTPQEVVDKMLELAAVKRGDTVYDLGCGDGRIVITAAKKYGCKAIGFDLDPKRVEESVDNVKKSDVSDLVSIQEKDIFTVDLSKANVVTLYLLPSLNVKLIPQLEKMKPGSRIVSHAFDMEGVKPKQTVKVTAKDGKEHIIYLWEIPLQKE